jgi:hypothetical protein
MLVLLMRGISKLSFRKIPSDIQKLLGGIHIQTHRQQGDLASLLLFASKYTGSRLKRF